MHTAYFFCLFIHLSAYFNVNHNKQILTKVGIEDVNKTIQANLVLIHIDLTSV
jgi:hypothetical protein